ncbi:MAG: hypothetical protein HGA45_13070 [Chloroflexales bacterium]|nr:hypothetical protein [Chloroflexales bacterium]
MRAIQSRLAALARQECYPQFEAGWRLVSALQVVPGLDQVLRVVRVQYEFLVLTITPGQPCRVQLRGNGALWYTPVVWQPQGRMAEQALTACSDSRMFFAADFDRHHTFHVNTWPEALRG